MIYYLNSVTNRHPIGDCEISQKMACGGCNVQAVMWNDADTDANTAAGFRVSLDPGQTAAIDTADNKSLTLRCGDYAERLEAVEGEPQFASK